MADNGKLLNVADYSGQEARLIACASGDELWVSAFRNNEDIHTAVAKRVFKITDSEVKNQAPFAARGFTYRDVSKTINYMLAFGGGAKKLSTTIRIPIQDAQKIIDAYFAEVPKVKKYLDESGSSAVMNGYSRTFAPIGRVRWYREHALAANEPDEFRRNVMLGNIERQGKNAPIQGSGADMVKLAMVKVRNWIRDNDMFNTVKQVLQVHDELIEEVDEHYEGWSEIKHSLMLKAGEEITTVVPMEVSIASTKKWTK